MSTTETDVDDLPFVIRNNSKASELWNNSAKEVRTAGLLISEYRTGSALSGIEANYAFADKWNKAFPNYKYGDKIVKLGAKLAGTSPTTIYSILKTTSFYDHKAYQALAAKANANGVVILWTHLRLISDRLNDNPDGQAAAEEALVAKQMTECQLKAFIAGILTADAPQEEPTALQRLDEVSAKVRNLLDCREWITGILEAVDNEFTGDAVQGQAILSKLSELTQCFEETTALISEQSEYIQQIYDAVLKVVGGGKIDDDTPEDDGDIFHEVAQIM